MEPITIEQVAKQLYDAYGLDAEWKNFQGNAMPAWEDLTDAVRAHWAASAREAVRMSNVAPTLFRKAA